VLALYGKSLSNKGDKDFISNFMVHLYPREEVLKTNSEKRVINTLSFVCLNAGFSFRQFARLSPRSIIIASGTLQPLNTFASELQVPFPNLLQNKHVIDKRQVQLCVVGSAQNQIEFNFSYVNQNNEAMLENLIESIASCA